MFRIEERHDHISEQPDESLHDDCDVPEPDFPPVQVSEFRQEYKNAIPNWTRIPKRISSRPIKYFEYCRYILNSLPRHAMHPTLKFCLLNIKHRDQMMGSTTFGM